MNNFCVAPWMHLHVINDGRAFPCCQTPIESKNSFGNVKTESIKSIMNSTQAKTMRKDMLENKPLPESCIRCTEKEKANMNSMRTGLNSKWKESVQDSIDTTTKDGEITNIELKYWDYRFSNFCNLACPTCSPLFSTTWFKDWNKLYPGLNKDPALVDLKDAEIFWNDLEKYILNTEEIHIAGGEPFMMPENIRILNLLDNADKTDVTIKYSTNCTNLVQKGHNIIDRLKKYNYVHLSCSIDAVEDAFEYIRYKGVWKTTFENLKKIRNSGLDYWIHPTVSILNIFRLTELHNILHKADIIPLEKVCETRGFNIDNYWVDRMHFNPLFTPEYDSITVLPPSLKEQAAEKITIYGKKLEKDFGIPFKGWQSILDFMYQSDNSNLYEEFLQKTTDLDSIRNNSFFKINKEFLDV